MISVNEAKEIISKNVVPLPSVQLSLQEAVGLVLAEDVVSLIDSPPFNQSSVDGYAIAFKDVKEKLKVNGEVPAGNNENLSLLPKQAIRIFTGAAIPANADTIVMQEKIFLENGELIIQDEQLRRGSNFRKQGADIKKDSVALERDTILSPAAIGFLAGLGITEVSVYKKPYISIIITGNELQQPGKTLQFGQVYESNSFMLQTALKQLYFDEVTVSHIDDNLQRLTTSLNNALSKSDIVLLAGGISVGDYDFVLQAATDCGIEKIFHKVKQRPGKPLYFGKKNNKYVFGLPGNPSSVLTCFYEYVVPALNAMMNKKSGLPIRVSLGKDYKKVNGLTFFLKGNYEDGKAWPLDAQESYRLSSFAKANCLIRLEENITDYKEGDIVEIRVLPN